MNMEKTLLTQKLIILTEERHIEDVIIMIITYLRLRAQAHFSTLFTLKATAPRGVKFTYL